MQTLNHHRQFVILAVIVFIVMCGFFGIDLHLASMPAIQTFMHTDKAHMQLSVSLYVLGTGLSLFFYGPLSDKYGRKPIVLFGLSIAAAACLLSTFTHHITTFLVLRFLQGFGAGVCAGMGRTILADMFQGDRLATTASYTGVVVSLSPLVAPTIGGYIQHWFGWHAVFVTLALLFFLAGVCFLCLCPESNHHRHDDACSFKKLRHNYGYILRQPIFLVSTLISGITMSAVIAYATLSAFLLQQHFHLSVVTYGWVTSAVGTGAIVGRYMSSRSVRYFGRESTIVISQILLVCASLWVALGLTTHWLTLSWLLIAVFLTIFSQALAQANTTSLALSPFKNKRGAAGTLYGGFQMLVTFATSAIISHISANPIDILMACYGILGIIGLMALGIQKMTRPNSAD